MATDLDLCSKDECKCEDAQRLLARYREYYDEAMPSIEALEFVLERFRAPLEQIKGDIKTIVVDCRESVKGHGITVTYRKGYERSKWNGKALDGYAAAHPEILVFKEVTEVNPTAAFKVEKVE